MYIHIYIYTCLYIYIWRIPKMMDPQVTMSFNTHLESCRDGGIQKIGFDILE